MAADITQDKQSMPKATNILPTGIIAICCAAIFFVMLGYGLKYGNIDTNIVPISVLTVAIFVVTLYGIAVSAKALKWSRFVVFAVAFFIAISSLLWSLFLFSTYAAIIAGINFALNSSNAWLVTALATTAGVILYAFRYFARTCYGITEVLAGIALTAFNASNTPGTLQQFPNQVYAAILTGGVYLVVRGLDNMENGWQRDKETGLRKDRFLAMVQKIFVWVSTKMTSLAEAYASHRTAVAARALAKRKFDLETARLLREGNALSEDVMDHEMSNSGPVRENLDSSASSTGTDIVVKAMDEANKEFDTHTESLRRSGQVRAPMLSNAELSLRRQREKKVDEALAESREAARLEELRTIDRLIDEQYPPRTRSAGLDTTYLQTVASNGVEQMFLLDYAGNALSRDEFNNLSNGAKVGITATTKIAPISYEDSQRGILRLQNQYGSWVSPNEFNQLHPDNKARTRAVYDKPAL